MRPGGCGTSPMIDSAVTLLPQPDSPTMPSVRPASRPKLTPSTAANSPPSIVKRVVRSRTSSRDGPPTLATVAAALPPEGRNSRLGRPGGAHVLHRRSARPGSARRPPRSPRGRWYRPGSLGSAGTQGTAGSARDFSRRACATRGMARVIVDAQIEERIFLGRMNEQRRGLLAPLVSARRVARLQCREQPLRERQHRASLVGRRRFRKHLRSRQHVTRDRVMLARAMSAPIDASCAGVRRRCALAHR